MDGFDYAEGCSRDDLVCGFVGPQAEIVGVSEMAVSYCDILSASDGELQM